MAEQVFLAQEGERTFFNKLDYLLSWYERKNDLSVIQVVPEKEKVSSVMRSRFNKGKGIIPHSSGLSPLQRYTQGIFVLLNRLIRRYRTRRVEGILEFLQSSGIEVVLDVGTSAGQFWTPVKDKLGALKIIGLDLQRPEKYPVGHYVVGSSLALPFQDKSVDCLISNSVIEHVGDLKAQQLFASEIRRVARSCYVVQVPAKHFPVEPHFLLPFVQYLPQKLKRAIHRRLYGFDPGDINLLDFKTFKMLFPEASIKKERMLLITKSFTAYGS